MEVQEDLESVHHEELLWSRKVRCDCLALRDQNTKFFHRRIIYRRKHNRITALKNDNEEWVFDEALQVEVVNFFQRLYGEVLEPLRGSPSSIMQNGVPIEKFRPIRGIR
ncbi:hypothetical protein J1N35_038134 [Gossypium stocksii]|uniref:Uncharacterized protein n=1 Tax=Gossypium stocksii TaxID=47602 RepID=A0A9D3ULB3_9ROSI|nr:hypothetical protein J1N35_038134 [Gossypium stocksii]